MRSCLRYLHPVVSQNRESLTGIVTKLVPRKADRSIDCLTVVRHTSKTSRIGIIDELVIAARWYKFCYGRGQVASWEGEKRTNSPIRKFSVALPPEEETLRAFHSRLLPGAHPPAPRSFFLFKIRLFRILQRKLRAKNLVGSFQELFDPVA